MSNKKNTSDSQINLMKVYTRVDESVETVLDKTDSVINKILELIKNLYKFLKKSVEKESIKKVIFMILMSICMAFVLMGVNVIFGKVIL